MLSSYILQFAWGLAVLAAFYGAGRGLLWLVVRDDLDRARVGPGIAVALGVAAWLALGGVLTAAHLTHREILIVLVGLVAAGGLLRALGELVVAPARLPRAVAIFWLMLGLVLLGNYALSVVSPASAFNAWDDWGAYLPLVRRALDAGDMVEPFSIRRLAAYGGQTFLMALAQAPGGTERNGWILERGLMPIVQALLAWDLVGRADAGAGAGAAYGRGERRAAWLVVAMGFTVGAAFVVVPAINTTSAHTGVVLFVAAATTLSLPTSAWPRLVLFGVALAGIVALRANYVAAAGVLAIVGAALMPRNRNDEDDLAEPRARDRWPAVPLRLAGVAGVCGLLLLPWAMALHESSGSLLYPVMLGNGSDPQKLFVQGAAPARRLASVVRTARNQAIAPYLLLPVILLTVRRSGAAAVALTVAALVGLGVTVWMLPVGETQSLRRYVAPPAVAAAVFAGAVALARVRDRVGPRRLDRAVVALVLSVTLGLRIARDARDVRLFGASAYFQRFAIPRLRESETERARRQVHRAAQDATPPGARILVATERPYLFDFRRNDVVNLDQPGFASPAPRMPLGQGGQRLLANLRAHRVDYLVTTTDGDGWAYYNPEARAAHLAGSPTNAALYPLIERFLEDVNDLESLCPVVYRDRDVRVFKVSADAPRRTDGAVTAAARVSSTSRPARR